MPFILRLNNELRSIRVRAVSDSWNLRRDLTYTEENLKKFVTGQTIRFACYLSTTMKLEGVKPGNCTMFISVPGHVRNCAHIREHSRNQTEEEVLFLPYSLFRVDDVIEDGATSSFHIELTALSDEDEEETDRAGFSFKTMGVMDDMEAAVESKAA